MNNNLIIKKEDIDLINERYGTNASGNDVEHYKLCQVIMHLESLLDPQQLPKPPDVEKSGEK